MSENLDNLRQKLADLNEQAMLEEIERALPYLKGKMTTKTSGPNRAILPLSGDMHNHTTTIRDGERFGVSAANLLQGHFHIEGGILNLSSFDQRIGHLTGGGEIILGDANLSVKSSIFVGTFSGTGIVTDRSTGSIIYSGRNNTQIASNSNNKLTS